MQITLIIKKKDFDILKTGGSGIRKIDAHIDLHNTVTELKGEGIVEEDEIALQLSVYGAYESIKSLKLRRVTI